MVRNVSDLRNFAVCGHGSSGKTSLVDTLLVRSGAVKANPSVDAGTSICDFDEEEKHHHHSVEATLAHFDHAGKHFNVIDTPGYPELVGQMIGSLRAVETALIVVDAHAGVKVNTRRAWREAEEAGCGRILVLTKIDADNVNIPEIVASLQETFGPSCLPLNLPIGVSNDLKGIASTLSPPSDASGAVMNVQAIHEALVESIIEVDEDAMERYFEGTAPTKQELAGLLVRAVAERTLTPIFCLSTKQNIGVTELMDALAAFAPSPDLLPRQGHKGDDWFPLDADPSAPLAAQVFKTRIDPFVQKLSFVRVYSGTLRKDAMIEASATRKGLKIAQLLDVQAGETHPVEGNGSQEVGPGEIVAIAKCEELHTGDSLGEIELPDLTFPEPMIALAVEPKSRGDEAKLSGALHKITEEDCTIHLEHDPETKEMVLTGMSELHLALIQERLHRRDHVDIKTHEPKVPYRETIQTNAEGSYRHKKQSGGAGQFAEIHIRMLPLPEGIEVEEFATKDRFPHMKRTHYDPKSNFLWIDSVVGGSIPGNFMPAIEKGFQERIRQGVVAGCPVQNICVEVHYGKDHPVDSNETAFKTAASKAFAQVFKEARPAILEPVVNMHVTVPEGNVGDVSSDLSGRRGQMAGMEQSGGGMTTIEAKAPLSEVATYARTLSSMTGGQGSFTMEFSHYEVVPGNIQQQIVEAAKHSDEEE
ncbi:elongation factor G [Adhaeretor mobilis]|uniref:Elongation factor G n=1 Tax=Adhaeretor mobilis TaxID=1930276 RepID=A0A517MZ35_9BACT|nr:elongation factor G [Adhaeretor mobilis]QDT00114.1 Elongation factor G [Adhaeretor mobilis]